MKLIYTKIKFFGCWNVNKIEKNYQTQFLFIATWKKTKLILYIYIISLMTRVEDFFRTKEKRLQSTVFPLTFYSACYGKSSTPLRFLVNVNVNSSSLFYRVTRDLVLGDCGFKGGLDFGYGFSCS